MEDQSHTVVIKAQKTGNRVFNTSEFMEGLFNHHQNIRFSGSSASHKNRAVQCTIKALITTDMNVFINAMMRYHKDTFTLIFVQLWWNMLCASMTGYLILILAYLLLRYGQGRGLRQYQMP